MENQLTLFKIRDLRQKDQFKIDDKYLNGYARICGVNATLVYNSLCRHSEFHTQKAFPSQEKIAYQHGISSKRVRAGIKKLLEYNIISMEKRRTSGKFMNYVYYLLDKSVWKKATIVQNRPMVAPQDIYNRWSTAGGKLPTKDNKETRITKNKDNKEREVKTSPAEEMKLFLNEKDYFNKVADLIADKSGIQKDLVLKELYSFKSYWSELNKSGKKQRWELQPTFQLKRRLATWLGNANKFTKQKGKNIIFAQ